MTRSWIDPKLAAAFAVVTVTAVSIPRVDAKCLPMECGMNTAMLRMKRINAIHLGGVANADGVALDVNSFRLDPWKEVYCRHLKLRNDVVGSRPVPIKRPPPLFLTIIDGELAAVDGSWDNQAPNERYRAMCLIGATFAIKVPIRGAGSAERQVFVRINRFGRLESWVDGKNDFARANEQVPSYLIVDRGKDLASSADDVALCPEMSSMEPWQLDRTSDPDVNPPGVDGVNQGLYSSTALLYQGEVYDENGTIVDHFEVVDDNGVVIQKTKVSGTGWFYFACPGTALHKARLMGMNPMQQGLAQTPLMRQSTLKMITARYDGATPETGSGIPLIWVPGDRVDPREVRRIYAGTNYVALTGAGANGTVDPTAMLEAVWGPSGALCLTDHPRVWDSAILGAQVWFKQAYKTKFGAQAEEAHRSKQKVPRCDELAPSTDAVWTTYSPVHDHL